MRQTFDREKFGEKLKQLRVNYGMTQTELAKKTGFSQNTISNWENGNREPDAISDLLTLADALHTSVSYFIETDQLAVNDWAEELYPDLAIPNYFRPELEGSKRVTAYLDFLKAKDSGYIRESTSPYDEQKKNLDYFADKPELLNIFKEIHDNESLQLLFDNAKDLKPQDLETVLMIIRGIKREREMSKP